MRRKRPSVLRTSQVARILGIPLKTFYRMLADGRLPEPQRERPGQHRAWTPVQVQQMREMLER